MKAVILVSAFFSTFFANIAGTSCLDTTKPQSLAKVSNSANCKVSIKEAYFVLTGQMVSNVQAYTAENRQSYTLGISGTNLDMIEVVINDVITYAYRLPKVNELVQFDIHFAPNKGKITHIQLRNTCNQEIITVQLYQPVTIVNCNATVKSAWFVENGKMVSQVRAYTNANKQSYTLGISGTNLDNIEVVINNTISYAYRLPKVNELVQFDIHFAPNQGEIKFIELRNRCSQEIIKVQLYQSVFIIK
jgi:hypothetical protein